MLISNVFKTYIEPSLERIPVLEVSHIERRQGRDYVISQTIHRNVFTDFDRKLSQHLAATRGAGFPAFTVMVRVAEKKPGGPSRVLSPAHHVSVPHALKGIADRAAASAVRVNLTIHHDDRKSGERSTGMRRELTTDDIDSLNEALSICRTLGEAEFLDISGDFDIVIAGPPGGQQPIVMHLQNGSITMPCTSGTTVTPFECPIHGFTKHVASNLQAQGYMARARHALVATKETAVMEFRAAAENRILNFDKALAGRALDGHRLDAAIALVERLKLGLGTNLSGLSEDARITALDWSSAIESGGESAVAGQNKDVMAHPVAACA